MIPALYPCQLSLSFENNINNDKKKTHDATQEGLPSRTDNRKARAERVENGSVGLAKSSILCGESRTMIHEAR